MPLALELASSDTDGVINSLGQGDQKEVKHDFLAM